MKTMLFILGFLTAVSSDAKTTHAFLKCTTPPDESGAYSKLRIITDQHGRLRGLRTVYSKNTPPKQQFTKEIENTFDSPVNLDDPNNPGNQDALMATALAAIGLGFAPVHGDMEQLTTVRRVKYGKLAFSKANLTFELIEIFAADGKSLGTVFIEPDSAPVACQ